MRQNDTARLDHAGLHALSLFAQPTKNRSRDPPAAQSRLEQPNVTIRWQTGNISAKIPPLPGPKKIVLPGLTGITQGRGWRSSLLGRFFAGTNRERRTMNDQPFTVPVQPGDSRSHGPFLYTARNRRAYLLAGACAYLRFGYRSSNHSPRHHLAGGHGLVPYRGAP